jgi:hypothetical protein
MSEHLFYYLFCLRLCKLVLRELDMCDLEKYFKSERTVEYPIEQPEEISSPLEEPVDLLPEFCVYEDEGCSLSPSCLNCPFPRCLFEMPWGNRKQAIAERNAEINRLFALSGISENELAARFKLSKRTIRRALAKKEK